MSKIKRKGRFAYGSDLQWHQNHSSQVIAKTIEKHLLNGDDVGQLIKSHLCLPDFLISAKVPRSSKLLHGEEQVENIIRYVVSNNGKPLTKVMPSKGIVGQYKRANKLTDDYYNMIKSEVGDIWDERINTKNKSIYEDDRKTAVQSGQLVTICNKLSDLTYVDLNYQWYIDKVEKITKVFQ